MVPKTNFLSLFSGIGGFDLAAYRCGLRFDRHLFSEIDPYAIKVFQARFPDAEALGDITKIKKEGLPDGDFIITGGFPCQDISVAGKGAGLAGARSGLWFEMLRLIGDLRPRFVVVENVGALIVRGIDTVLGTLAEIGYDAEWQIISASSVGAPHRRERVYIVSYPAGLCREAFKWSEPNGILPKVLADPERERLEEQWRAEPIQAQHAGIEYGGEDVADPDEVMRNGSWKAWDGRLEYSDSREALANASNGGNVRRNGQLESAQGQVREHRGSAGNGRGEWWATEPDVGRVANGIPFRVDRLKCLGNAIVPQCAEVIFNLPAFDEWRTA